MWARIRRFLGRSGRLMQQPSIAGSTAGENRIGQHCPCDECSDGRIIVRQRRERRKGAGDVWVFNIECNQCGWRPNGESWSQPVEEHDKAVMSIKPQSAELNPPEVSEQEHEGPRGEFLLRLKPGLSDFRRTVDGQVLRFNCHHPTVIAEHQLPDLMSDIRKGALEPVEWTERPRGWTAIPLEDLDLDATLLDAKASRLLLEILRGRPG